MKAIRFDRYIAAALLLLLLASNGIIASRGKEIHEEVCPGIKTVKVKKVIYEGTEYSCLKRECVYEGKVYEVYKQKGFFNDNIRVKAVDVSTMDIFPDKDLIAVIGGIKVGGAYYAVVSEEGLIDGEAVMVLTS